MSPRSTSAPIRRRRILLLAATALVVSSCGVDVSGSGDLAGPVTTSTTTTTRPDVLGPPEPATTEPTAPPTTAPPPVDDVEIFGADDSVVTDVVVNAVTDLEGWWAESFPEAYDGEEYEELQGGLFAMDSDSDLDDLPCTEGASEVAQVLYNAYYCSLEDTIAWDQEFLMPDLVSRYGEFTVAVVLAHEWGHAIQYRAEETGADDDIEYEATVTTELQADCFAGAWSNHVMEGGSSQFEITMDQLDQALAGILSFSDPVGADANDPSAHGSGFDRVGAFQDGYEQGVTRCAEYTADDPVPYSFEFETDEEEANGGNMALEANSDGDGIVEAVFPALDLYWTEAFPELADGAEWDPLVDPRAFTEDEPPVCGDEEVVGYTLFTCVPDRYVAYDIEAAFREPYDQIGDFAVGALVAIQYGLDVEEQRAGGAERADAITTMLRADCYTGAWAAALLPQDAEERAPYGLTLSPGDLDEGVAVLLTERSDIDKASSGPGFDRVAAFRIGVVRGIESCADVEPS